MHFLSHYYTELPAGDPLFVVGLAIPDLTPRFTKAYNLNIVKHTPYTSHALKQIHLGIVNHFEADKRFHGSPLFVQHVTYAIQSFLQAGLNRQRLRLSVIAHIAVEMMLDRKIIQQDATICTRYYSLIEQADEGILGGYFDGYKMELEKQNFLRSFQFYKQKKFLLLFNELENIVEGLSRVYSTVTKTPFSEEEKRNFLTALHNIDNHMRYSWQQILECK
jgi:hypothetical protein